MTSLSQQFYLSIAIFWRASSTASSARLLRRYHKNLLALHFHLANWSDLRFAWGEFMWQNPTEILTHTYFVTCSRVIFSDADPNSDRNYSSNVHLNREEREKSENFSPIFFINIITNVFHHVVSYLCFYAFTFNISSFFYIYIFSYSVE